MASKRFTGFYRVTLWGKTVASKLTFDQARDLCIMLSSGYTHANTALVAMYTRKPY